MADISNQNAAYDGGDARRFSLPCEAIPYILSTADTAVIVSCSLLSAIGYHFVIDSAFPNFLTYAAVGLIASFIYTVRLSGRGHFDFEIASKPRVEILNILITWATTILLLAFFAFVLKLGVSFSRGSFFFFLSFTPAALLIERKIAKRILVRAIANGAVGRRNMVLIGDQEQLSGIESRELLNHFGAGEVNRFHMAHDADPAIRRDHDRAILIKVCNFVRQNASSGVLVALPWADIARIEFVTDQLKYLPVSTRLLPDRTARALTQKTPAANQLALSIELQRAPLSLLEQLIKRSMDIVFSLIGLVVFSPILLFTAIAIKLCGGRGPVIFRQDRKGFGGVRFKILKFRTMSVTENGDVIKQAAQNDSRITGIGRLLRASSIDELPQLINVLVGDMSLVGPRPHAIAHDNEFEKLLEDYAFRHNVKPGITGWAQVHGLRGGTPTVDHIANRVKMDIWYINNWSLWLDIQIVFTTVFEVIRRRNAY